MTLATSAVTAAPPVTDTGRARELSSGPQHGPTWEVADVATEVTDLQARGVRFEDDDLPGLKTVDHVAGVEGERPAWFPDPDGNVLCIHQAARAGGGGA